MRYPWLNPRGWPLTIRVPLLVAGLMILVGVIASQLVLNRLAHTQEGHFRALTTAFLDGTAAAVTPHVLRRDVWEAFDIIDRGRSLYKGLNVIDTVVLLADGLVLASTDPARFPTLRPPPGDVDRSSDKPIEAMIDSALDQVTIERDLDGGGGSVGTVLAIVDVSRLLTERREVLVTLVLLNAGVTLTLAVIGYIAVRRMLAPVALLTAHVETIRDGRPATLSPQLTGDAKQNLGGFSSASTP